jgi:hypothetical protein
MFRVFEIAWPDEALERGLSRAMAKRRKNWGRVRLFDLCLIYCYPQRGDLYYLSF